MTKTIFTIISVFLLIHIPMWGQQYLYNLKFEISPKKFVDTIPIKVVNERIFIPVSIEGQAYHFLLDTGAGMGMVYDNVNIPGQRDAGTIAEHDATGGVRQARVVEISNINIGKLNIKNYPVTVKKRRGSSSHDGIIGFNLFNKGIAAKIDLANKRLILTDIKKMFSAEKGIIEPYKLQLHVPNIRTSPFERQRAQAIFDTGCSELFLLCIEDYKKIEAINHDIVQQQTEGKGQGYAILGQARMEPYGDVAFLRLKNLLLGKLSLQDVHCITTQGKTLVGAKLLRYGSIIINPFKRRLLFQPAGGGDHIFIGNQQTEIAFVPNDAGKPTIGLIWEASRAYKAGFRQGYIIERINDLEIDWNSFVNTKYTYGQIYKFSIRTPEGKEKIIHSAMPILKNK